MKRITIEVDDRTHLIIKKHVLSKGFSIKDWVLAAIIEKLNLEKKEVHE